jgi:hypothetical protein
MTEYLDDSEYAQRRYRDLRRDDVWKRLFARHPDIPDHEANRKAIYDYAFSLADGTITFANLDEAAKTHPSLNRQDKHFATAENAKQDEETLKQFCRDHRLQFNFAALNMLRHVYGGGFKPIAIDQALQSGQISFVRANDEDVARWDTEDAQELVEEIVGARIMTRQDRLKFESMPLEQLRAEVVRIREERRLRRMTGTELRAYLRQQRPVQTHTSELDDMSRDNILLSIEASEREKEGGGADYIRRLLRQFGPDAVNQKLNNGGYVKPQIAGIVREVVHPFDKN